MNPNGIARADIDVVDLSVLINTGLKGITGVVGITERGEINKPVLVGSWIEFVREFGGLMTDSDFPLLCRRALEAGAKLMVSRVGHYTDIDDKTTLAGAKAGEWAVDVNDEPSFAFEAASIGAWGNGVKLTITAALSGLADHYDILVTLTGYPDLSQTITNVNGAAQDLQDPTIVEFNRRSKYVKIIDVDSSLDGLTDQEVVLSLGSQDTSVIVDVDVVGSTISQSGIHSFDNISDITKIAAPEWAKAKIDAALANYADMRGDIIALLRTPIGLDGNLAVEYREKTGAYAGSQPIDTWRAFMFTGDLLVTDPLTNTQKELSAIGDILGIISTKDNKSKEWFSFSGSKRGRIKNALGVIYNLGSPALQTTANLVDNRGLNMIIDHPSFGIVAWGNGTLQKEPTLLKHANVAELIIFLVRGLRPIIQSELFQPNDIETWKAIHRKVKPFMDAVKDGRGIWDYLYQGDQDIDRLEDAVVNTPDGIDAGKYEFNLFVKPKVAMKYIGLKVAVSNSGVSFDVLTNTNLD